MRAPSALALLLFVPTLPSFAIAAAQTDILTAHRVAELRTVGAAEMSPDGSRIAYVLAVPRKPGIDEDGGSWTELHVVDVASGVSRPYVTGKGNVSSPRWTADGKALAFLQKRADDKSTALYMIELDGGEARRAHFRPFGPPRVAIRPTSRTSCQSILAM